MVNFTHIFAVLAAFIQRLFLLEIGGLSIMSWYILFWIIAIIGWILQAMYGRKDD